MTKPNSHDLRPAEIKEIRAAARMTMSEVAMAVGVSSRVVVWRWEHGRSVPRQSHQRAILKLRKKG